jgi:hypothetical protein
VIEKTVKTLMCCGFRRIDKAMAQVFKCWWRICREILFFPSFEYHMFYFLYLFVTFLLTDPRNMGTLKSHSLRTLEIHESVVSTT